MTNNFSNSINSNIGAANSGATNTLTVTNPSNTASSQANEVINVGGGTAGDPFITYTVTGATSWSEGIDNSASDAFVIAASTALGTTNVVSMATGGNVSVVLGDLDITRSNSGANVTSTISNTSNTATSNALQQITVAGTSANDAFTTYTVSGTTNWSQGVDNSVTSPFADPYVLSASTALGTTNVMVAQTTGAINYPLQPAFLAYQASQATDVTGDNTAYQLGTTVDLTEIFDQGSNFDPTTGTFTAPVTGRYYLAMSAYISGATIATTFGTLISTSNQDFIAQVGRAASSIQQNAPSQILCDMDAADTAIFFVASTGEAGKTDDVYGQAGSPRYTWACGNLVC